MNKIISTDRGPGAIGPYSQAVQTAGGMLFVSGQIPLVPATGAMVEGGIEAQATQVLENLKGIVEAAGYQLSDVVKTTVPLPAVRHGDRRQQELAGAGPLAGAAIGVRQDSAGAVPGGVPFGSQGYSPGVRQEVFPVAAAAP